MAWSITLSKDGRHFLAGILRGLLIIQLINSLIMAIFCYNSSVKVLSLLEGIHKYTVLLLYGLILLQAYCTKLHYTSGFRLMTWLLRYPHWHRTAAITKMWLVSGTLIAANGILVQAACKNIVKRLMKEISQTLRGGVSQYFVEHSWKVLLDTLQVELNCCGVDHPRDWHEIHWLNVDFFNEDSDIVMELAADDGRLLPPVSPYSCCTPYVHTACYHDPLQQYQDWREHSSTMASASLSARGCVRAVSEPLRDAVLLLQALSIAMFLFQIIIICLTVLLRDSHTESHEEVTHGQQFRSEISMGRGILSQRRSMRRVRSRGYACLS